MLLVVYQHQRTLYHGQPDHHSQALVELELVKEVFQAIVGLLRAELASQVYIAQELVEEGPGMLLQLLVRA